MILVIGAPDDAHAAHIHQELTRQGQATAYFDSRRFPAAMTLSLTPETPAQGCLKPENYPAVALPDIRAVYWRYFMGINTDGIEDPFLKDMANREIYSAIGSLFRMLDAFWINSPDAVDMHRYKGYQLQVMKRAGLQIPETLMTNDGDALKVFFQAMRGQVIYKPIMGGAHTTRLSEDDLTADRLASLSKAPVQFQEFIPGTDIRVYCIGNECFAAEIRSNTIDFRDDPQASIVPITLPDNIQEQCFTAARILGLFMTGIDIRRTDDNRYVFLEANPSPMFLHFENKTGYPISKRLIHHLISAGGTP